MQDWRRALAGGRGAALCPLVLLLCQCSNDQDALLCDPPDCPADRDASASPEATDVAPDPRRAVLEIFGPECADCVERECAGDVAACVADDACAEEVLCEQACGLSGSGLQGPPCHEACRVDYALGLEPSSTLASCAVASCAAECPVGQDYACKGDFEWPAPAAAVSALKLQLGEFSSGGSAEPLLESGIRVRVCRFRDDPACSMPFREHVTTDSGAVDLLLPNRGGDNNGYTPFDGFLAFDDPEAATPRIRPTLLFFNRAWPAPDDWSQQQRIDTLLVTLDGILGSWPSAGTGLVAGALLDCRSSNVARGTGLTVQVSAPSASPFYNLGSSTTNHFGFFAVSDVPPGSTELRVLHGEQVITTVDLPVIADTVTYVWLWPDAAPR